MTKPIKPLLLTKDFILVSIETGKELNVGDEVVVEKRKAKIISLNPPKSMSSSGKVFLKFLDKMDNDFEREFFPSVIDAYFKEKK